jgi:hypothetical protein
LPYFVEHELRSYLRCGILSYGASKKMAESGAAIAGPIALLLSLAKDVEFALRAKVGECRRLRPISSTASCLNEAFGNGSVRCRFVCAFAARWRKISWARSLAFGTGNLFERNASAAPLRLR